MKIDEKVKNDVRSGSSDKQDWLKNHTLSKEQVAQLMLNKYNRAIVYQKMYSIK